MLSTLKDRSIDTADLDERRALVRRITRSSAFGKSERLSSLLIYVCEVTLQGKGKELNEQKIGAAVFGKAPDYDSSIDGIVRTQASRLRHRLDQYFKEEGADEPLQIVIPRGGYIPFFEPRLPVRNKLITNLPLEEVAALEVSAPKTVPPAGTDRELGSSSLSTTRRYGLPWIAGLLAVALVVVLAVALVQRRPEPIPSFAHAQGTGLLWGEMFVPGQSTLLVFGDSGLVMWHGSSDRSLGLTDYMRGDYRADETGSTPNALSATDLSNRRYTTVVDLELVHALDRIAIGENSNLEVRYARDARPNDLKQGDVILIGASEANPWVELFEPRMNFVFVNDRPHQTMSVVNRSPRAGEAQHWESANQDAEHRVFGVLAFLPTVNGNGNALLLEGTSMAGTESAWDFVSDAKQFSAFMTQIGGSTKHVPYFEAVLGTNNFGGSAAKTTVLAWRRID
jgi:hypothetical protein